MAWRRAQQELSETKDTDQGQGTKDQELLFLRAYLEQLFPHPDFRALNRKMFKLRSYLESLA